MNTIGWAVEQMNGGKRVRRSGWNGKGMYIALMLPSKSDPMTSPYVFMSTVQGDLIPWLCSQADLLANDWETI